MKSFCLSIVAVIIGLVSFQVETKVEHDFVSGTKIEKLHRLPYVDSASVDQFKAKSHFNKNCIAQEFIPIVVIANELKTDSRFQFYLPIYSLERENEYFLLI